MKSFLFVLFVIVFFSNCTKNKFISEDKIPQWLKEEIAMAEDGIALSDTKDMINYGAWVRYKFKNDYYFEYQNPFMSMCCFMYDFDGNYFSSVDLDNYSEDKCCERFVWKAPKYDEIFY